ncbi:bifunctional hemolysin/adenylate cyclase, partial [Elysia marginata]
LLGSNDGVNFEVIDTQTSVTDWTSRETKTYSLSSAAEYRFFKLDITDNNGDTYTGLDGFQLFEGTTHSVVGDENEVLTVDILANDIDADHNDSSANFTLNTVQIVDENDQPVSGQGTVTVDGNQLRFDPGSDFDNLAAGESTSVTVRYTMSDNEGSSSTSTVTLVINGTNDKPTAEVASVNATEDGTVVTGNFGATDADTTDAHTFNILTQPDEGSVTNNNDGTFSFNPGSDFQDLAAGETRQVTFTYEAVDDSGTANDTSEAATVTITITGTNDKPTAEVESVSATENGAAVTGNFGATDADTTDTHTFNILTQPSEGTVTNNNDGTFSFNPGSDFQDLAAGETRQVTFTYEAVDDSGTANDTSEPATVTITITGTNDKPTADVESISATEDGSAVTGNFGATDADTTDTHTFNILTQPDEGSVTNNNDGTFSFNPGSDFQDLAAGETRQVTFTYEAVDDSGTANDTSEPATVTITITGTNDAPVAVVDSDTTSVGSTLLMDVLANDTDVDSNDNASNFSLDNVNITGIADSDGSRTINGGTVSIENNQLKFVPGSDFDYLAVGESATVTVSYTMSDDSGATSTATATITVSGTNSTPVAQAVNVGATEDGAAVSGNFAATDDNTTDTHTFNILTQPTEGTVINNNDGTFSFNPGSDFQDLAAGETRQVTFTYEAVDDSGAANATSEAATVTITITGTNDKPTAAVESISATEDGAAVTGNF